MSLMERVEAAGCGQPLAKGSAHLDALDELRRQVQLIIAADEIAAIMSHNPKRAENEVRTACEAVFAKDPWLAPGEQTKRDLISALLDRVFGFGPLESMLADEGITEIMVNASNSLFVERDGKLVRQPDAFSDDEQVRALIDRIIGPLGRRIDESSPTVNARLPQGHRVHAVIPPIAIDGPVLTIRKFREHVISLEEMVRLGSFDWAMLEFFTWAVRSRKHLAVSGGTGSGKTTLLNALSCKISPDERIITIEDSAELRFHEHPHVVRMEARPKNAEGLGEVTIRELVINALRMRPDRIVVGECRGAEALDMLQAMNTGHDGSLTTLHANAPQDAILRLSTMVRYAGDLPVDVIEAQIASALDCIVQTARAPDGHRFVSDVVEVAFDRGRRCVELKPLFVWERFDATGAWVALPSWLDELPLAGVCTREEVEAWKQVICS